MAWRPQPSSLGRERRSRYMRGRECCCWIIASLLDISSSSDNPLWDKDTFLSFCIHRVPEKHFLSQSWPPLLSSRAQQLQSAPTPRTEILSPVALQPADLVHIRTSTVKPHAARLVHQCASGVSLPAPVHKPESRKCQVRDCCVCPHTGHSTFWSVFPF